MSLHDALKLIATRSADMHIVQEALRAMRSTSEQAQQMRYSWLLPQAFGSGEFSEQERAEMIALLEPTEPPTPEVRDGYIQLRASLAERDELKRRAAQAGMTMSDYVRMMLGLG